MSSSDYLEDPLAKHIEQNPDKGESAFSYYKGQALQRLSGRMTNEESLALGHYDGLTNTTLNTIKSTEEMINALTSLQAELVPVMKKTSKGMVWITDEVEAKREADKEDLSIINIHGKWYFQYPGFTIQSEAKYIMTSFVYNIARASGSLGGETKIKGFEAVSNIKAVPIFPQMQSMRPMPEVYGQDYQDKDAD